VNIVAYETNKNEEKKFKLISKKNKNSK